MPPKKQNTSKINKNNFVTKSINVIIVGIILFAIWYFVIKKDGYFTEWSEWSNCDKTCGTNGKQIRNRTYVSPKYLGSDDPKKNINALKESRSCIPAPPENCPIDASYGDWSEWTECDKECGYGTQTRNRIYNKPQYGGKDIENIILSESNKCIIKECSNQPATVSEWKDISTEDIYYYDNNKSSNRLLAIKINKVLPSLSNYTFYKQQERIFTKESSDYKGNDILSKILTTELNNKRITKDEYNKLKINGGSQSQYIPISNKTQFKYIASKDPWKLVSECMPKTGRERKKTFTTIYYAATGSNEQDSEFKLFSDKFLSLTQNNTISHPVKMDTITITYTIKRVNNNEPKKFEIKKEESCDPISTFSIDEIQQIWKDTTGCNVALTDDILSSATIKKINDFQYDNDSSNFIQNIDSWTRKGILNEQDINKRNIKLQQCYSPNNVYINNVLSNEIKNNTIIYPGICYSGTHEWVNDNIRLIYSSGILECQFLYNNGSYYTYWKSQNTSSDAKNILCMQNNGNLTIIKPNGQIEWSSNTAGNNGAYAEINSKSGGFCIKNKDGNIIKYLLTKNNGTANVYIGGNKNWKYVKNNSIKGLLSDWIYYDPYTKTVSNQSNKVTLTNETQPWGMTENATDDNERNDSDMIKPINLKDSSGDELGGSNNIVHIVLLNRFGERIYIEPSVFQNILTKNDYKTDANNDLGCKGDEYVPISSYRINYLIDSNYVYDPNNILVESANKLTDKIFRNEWDREYRDPFRFKQYSIYDANDPSHPSYINRDFGGAIHSNSNKYLIDNCTQFYNLYDDNRYKNQKEALKNDGFVNIKNSINDGKNWISYLLSGEGYDQYWRVYERNMQNYVNYLNSTNHPEYSTFTNKLQTSSFANKLQTSSFANKLQTSYLESILLNY